LNNGGFFDGTACHAGTCANGATCGDNEVQGWVGMRSGAEQLPRQSARERRARLRLRASWTGGSTAECTDAKRPSAPRSRRAGPVHPRRQLSMT
jgi:hypothetical protein